MSRTPGPPPRAHRIPVSAEGRAGMVQLRDRLTGRPRDETLSIAERRSALAVFAAAAGASVRVAHRRVGDVPVEIHGDPDAGVGTVVYAHGGAFVIGSAATHRPLAAAIALAAGLPLVAVDYRLAPEHPFPAGRDDLVSVYRRLARDGGRRVALVGDSAGGGLVLQAALAIRDAGLPPPAAIAITSPWVDLACRGASYRSRRDVEALLTPEGLALDAARYLGGRAPRDPAVSPCDADLAGLPPVLIQVGEDEILLDDSLRLAEALAAHGVTAELEVWEGMPHAWHAFRYLLPEADAAIARLGAFLRAACPGGA